MKEKESVGRGTKIQGYKLPFYVLNEDDVNYLLKQGIEKYTIPIWDHALEIITTANDVTTLTELWNQFSIYIGNLIDAAGIVTDHITPFTVVAANHGVKIKKKTEYGIVVEKKEETDR